MAMEILAEAFANMPEGADAESVLLAAIERSNSAIFQMAHELPQLSSMATTIVALHLNGNIATIGHVGDSRLYRVDREGNLYRETDDHSMVAEEVRAGRMTEEQAENHPSRNVISRALGAEPTVDADVKTILVEPGTAFLICSDGITRHVADQEIKGVLTFGGDPSEVCEYLKDLCYERGAEDNLTAVVVKIAAEVGSSNGRSTFDHADLLEEPTIASARLRNDDDLNEDEGELLELDTVGPREYGGGIRHEDELLLNDNTLPQEDQTLEQKDSTLSSENEQDLETEEISVENEPPIVPVPIAEKAHESTTSFDSVRNDKTVRNDNFPMFGESQYSEDPKERSNSLGTIASSIAMLTLGALLGLGAYHFLLAPVPQERVSPPPITVMQSANQQLSAFEENRRTVDKMPSDALSRFGADPRDAEDFFLVGRAHLLLGQYPEARQAFTESRSRMLMPDGVDPNNKRTIETDIAVAMAVMNDTTVQNIFRTQLDSSLNNNANSNANTAR
jgi:serine/threonine protein phosphatase PrpC